jgi:hypothetical protein
VNCGGLTLPYGAVHFAIALVSADEIRQSSIMIEELTASAKNLPVQSFDAF